MKFPEHRKSFKSSPQNSGQAHSFVRTASSKICQMNYFSLHSYTRARRAVGPRIEKACFAHPHDSDRQSYFVKVVGNRCYVWPFRLNLPTARTKCGGSYCRVFLGCNARPSYRIVETSRARVAHPVDRSAGDALTPRGATVPRERSDRQFVARQSRAQQKIAGHLVLISPMSVSRLCRLNNGSSRDAQRFLRPSMARE